LSNISASRAISKALLLVLLSWVLNQPSWASAQDHTCVGAGECAGSGAGKPRVGNNKTLFDHPVTSITVFWDKADNQNPVGAIRAMVIVMTGVNDIVHFGHVTAIDHQRAIKIGTPGPKSVSAVLRLQSGERIRGISCTESRGRITSIQFATSLETLAMAQLRNDHEGPTLQSRIFGNPDIGSRSQYDLLDRHEFEGMWFDLEQVKQTILVRGCPGDDRRPVFLRNKCASRQHPEIITNTFITNVGLIFRQRGAHFLRMVVQEFSPGNVSDECRSNKSGLKTDIQKFAIDSGNLADRALKFLDDQKSLPITAPHALIEKQVLLILADERSKTAKQLIERLGGNCLADNEFSALLKGEIQLVSNNWLDAHDNLQRLFNLKILTTVRKRLLEIKNIVAELKSAAG